MNRIIKVFVSVLLVSICSGFKPPEQTAEKIIKLINSKKNDDLEKLYLTIDEFLILAKTMNPSPSEKEIEKFKNSYEQKKALYISSLKNSIKRINVKRIKLDSVKYDYQIPKLGPDVKINWPESKKHIPSDSTFTGLTINIFFTNKKTQYLMTLNMVHIEGEFRFLYLMSSPSIIEMN